MKEKYGRSWQIHLEIKQTNCQTKKIYCKYIDFIPYINTSTVTSQKPVSRNQE
jgi:hypothetical protein